MPMKFDRAEFLSVHESIREQIGAEGCDPVVADTYLRLLNLLEAKSKDSRDAWNQVVKLSNSHAIGQFIALALGGMIGALAMWLIMELR